MLDAAVRHRDRGVDVEQHSLVVVNRAVAESDILAAIYVDLFELPVVQEIAIVEMYIGALVEMHDMV